MQTSGKFETTNDGKLVWTEVETYPLSQYEQVYLCRQAKDPPHMVYKLTKAPAASSDHNSRFFWAALWNTSAHTSGRKNGLVYFETIQQAIKAKLDDGATVIRAIAKDFYSGPYAKKFTNETINQVSVENPEEPYEYLILQGGSPVALESEVEKHVSDGYRLVGGLATDIHGWYQAVERRGFYGEKVS